MDNQSTPSGAGFPWVYCLLAFGISWVFWIPAAASGQDSRSTIWIIPSLLGGFGPSVAGIVVSHWRSGNETRRDFWRRTTDFRKIGPAGYLFAILGFPGFCTISVLVESLVGQAPPLSVFSTIAARPAILIQQVLIGIFLGALSEELGWRGYALDKFQARWAPLPSALLLGVIWWAWHLPLFFTKGTTQNRWGFASPHFFLFFFWIVALSLLMTWLFNHNGRSTLLAVLVHFVSNFTLGLILPISALGFLFLVVLLVAAAIAVVLSGGLRTPASASETPLGIGH